MEEKVSTNLTMLWYDQDHDVHRKEFSDLIEWQTFARQNVKSIVAYILYRDVDNYYMQGGSKADCIGLREERQLFKQDTEGNA